MGMLLAFGPQDLGKLAIPIGIGLAVLLILAVPSLRRSVLDIFQDSHKKGKDARDRMTGKKTPEEDSGNGPRRGNNSSEG